MSSTFTVELKNATAPLVLALDVGSTASRGMIYDAHGRPVGKRAKLPHVFTTRADGTSQVDPDQIVEEVATLITTLVDIASATPISAVALDTFASSLIVLDADGAPLTPCFTYADGRCSEQVTALRTEVVESEYQQLTGTRLHSSYWPARLRWLASEMPDVVARAVHYVSLGDYVLAQLTGTLATGTSTASWTGMVDRQSGDWSPAASELAGVRREQLPPIHHLDQPVQVKKKAAKRLTDAWPALAGAVWFATIADGLSANVGLGAHDETTMGGSCATSGALRVMVRDLPAELPGGLWCYRVSHDRALLGGAMNDVGRALSWAESAYGLDQVEPSVLGEALSKQPEPETPLVLPFLTGERSTGWAAGARAIMSGVSASTSSVELYRAMAEGVSLAFVRIASQLRSVATQVDSLVVGGRVATTRPELLRVMADAMDVAITPVPIRRSTLRGTALLALESLAPDVERVAPPHGDVLNPNARTRAYYDDRAVQFERVYDALLA